MPFSPSGLESKLHTAHGRRGPCAPRHLESEMSDKPYPPVDGFADQLQQSSIVGAINALNAVVTALDTRLKAIEDRLERLEAIDA